MIRLTKDRKSKYINTGIHLLPDQWDEAENAPKKKIPNYIETKLKLLKAQTDMEKIILNKENDDSPYTLDDLAKLYHGTVNKITVDSFIDGIAKSYIKSGNIGNAKAYKALKSMLLKFSDGKDITFQDINASFLQRLELFFRGKNYKDTSLSTYMRTLRSVYNKAIENKCAREKDYPFRDFRLSRYNTATVHRAISKEDIKKVMKRNIKKGTRQFDSRNYFIFSYLTRGINFKDLALLKWENIINDRLIYERAKTGSPNNIKLLPEALKIIHYYKNFKTTAKSPYIFPILSEEHSTPTQIDNRIHKMLGYTNKDLKAIGVAAGIDIKLTTYVARHAYATALRNAGHSIPLISQSLGHKSMKTTQIYLDSFGNDILDEAEKDLL
jgi:integrase